MRGPGRRVCVSFKKGMAQPREGFTNAANLEWATLNPGGQNGQRGRNNKNTADVLHYLSSVWFKEKMSVPQSHM